MGTENKPQQIYCHQNMMQKSIDGEKALYVMLLVHCKKNIVVMLSVLKFIPDRRSSNKAWEDLYN